MEKGVPKVSVIMSVFNGEQFLHEAVESVLNQSFKDFEFIIINDGSTDGTREILESYSDDRFVLIHQDNTGLTRALNKGLLLARGEYIARVDADDVSRPERLEMQVNFLSTVPKIVLVGSNYYKIDEKGSVIEQTDLPLEDVQIKWNLIFHNCLCHSTVMFKRKEVTSLGGYNNNVSCAQDYDLWLRIAEKYPIANLKETLVYHRMPRQGTITYEMADDQKQQAKQLHTGVLDSLKPRIACGEDEIKTLRRFIFGSEAIKEIDNAEKLFNKIYTAFCNSPFVNQMTANKLKAIKIEPYVKFAWEYFNQASLEDFNRCINEVMDSGFQGPFDIPAFDLCKKEKYIFNVLNKYFFSDKQSLDRKKRGKDFLCNQYIHNAWGYYSMGDMKNFRRCLVKSLSRQLSVKGLILLLKSLLGKRTMEEVHRIRLMLAEKMHLL